MAQNLIAESPRVQPGQPVREYTVTGGAGVGLHAREWGNPDGTGILFVHGWSQSQLCWRGQVDSSLAERYRMITFDNRGHGMSEKPLDPAGYGDERLWADDVAAVIDQTGLERPVVVAWSYGGFIVSDYLRAHGDSRIGGINLVGGAVMLTPTSDHIGPGLLANAQDCCVPDLSANLGAIQRFLRSCTVRPMADEVWNEALGWNMVVRPLVRGAMFARQTDGDDVLRRLSVPVLVTHGREDAIVLPSMAEHVLAVCPTAVPSWYEGAGHMPFLEDAERFNRELGELVDRARG